MAYDYANDPVWGSDYRRAVASGDQNYIQKLQTAMNSNPAAQGTAGQIMAQTLNQGRSDGSNIWANGAAGTQVNGIGQIRTAQPTQGWNVTPSGNGGLYSYKGQQAPAGPSNIIGQAQGTMTQAQYGAANPQMESTKPLAVSQPPQWNPGSTFGGGQFGGQFSSGALQQLMQQLMQQRGSGRSYGPQIAGADADTGFIGDGWGGQGGSYFGPNGWHQGSGATIQGGTPYGGYQGWGQLPQPVAQNPGLMDDTHGMYRPQQTNWGGGYGSRQGMFNAGPLSQMFNSGWRR